MLAERAGLQLSAASISALMTKQPAQLKLSTLGALCTALECSPNDLLEVDITPVEAATQAGPDDPCSSEGGPGTVDAATMRLADCIRCGGGIGFKSEILCHRCRAADREAARRADCPACGEFLRLNADTGRCVRCSRTCVDCGQVLRFKTSERCRACRLRAETIAAKSPCPHCGRPGFIRADTGWCGSCSAGRATVAGPAVLEVRGAGAARRVKACAAAAGLAARPGPSPRPRT